MHWIDWSVLASTLILIVLYGIWKTRHVSSAESFLLGDRNLPWWTIGLSIMATQASAITFLSTPGQAFEEGMGFAQFYFGLPVAMVILCIWFLPRYYKLKVFTAYEYLEQRFDVKVRVLTATLFLISRGLAAGITIFAPSIILSSILGWELFMTNLVIGLLVIIYTVAGGTTAVSQTQKQQMIVILSGMFIAFFILLSKLPQNIGFVDSLKLAGQMGKLDIVNFEFDLTKKYNMWTAMLGGTFLFLSYFGTDQSQVQRYLSGKSLTESRLGLLFNGIFKVPMQFFILLVGLMVFIFYQFNSTPVHFNEANVAAVSESSSSAEFDLIERRHQEVYELKKEKIEQLLTEIQSDAGASAQMSNEVVELVEQEKTIRAEAKDLIKSAVPDADVEDADYVFIHWVTRNLPVGLIGLLLAVIFSAAMSSTASEINALATTTVVDLYKRNFARKRDDNHYLRVSKLLTIIWGVIALIFATFASLFENLIEAVNIIGSLFYGTILGIFIVGFFFKNIRATPVLIAAIISEILVITTITLSATGVINLSYLMLNLIGCALVVMIAHIFDALLSD